MAWQYWAKKVSGGSTAGDSFTLQTTPADLSWYGLTYGNGVWVAVADSGTDPVMTSPDGVTWTQRTATNVRWRDVCFSQTLNLFCASSITGTSRIMTSPDGTTWTDRTAGFATTWYGVFYGNGYFVSCGNGRIQYSTNGTSWTAITVPAGDYRCVTYSPDLDIWVIAGNGVIATATNPTGTWTARTGASGLLIGDITWDNGRFIGVNNTSSTNMAITSTDGTSWSTITATRGFGRFGIAYGNGRWINVGGIPASPRMDDSTDATTWVDADFRMPSFTGQLQRIRYADNKFVSIISTLSTGQRVLLST